MFVDNWKKKVACTFVKIEIAGKGVKNSHDERGQTLCLLHIRFWADISYLLETLKQ